MNAPAVANADLLTGVFGEWPSFRGAEMLCLVFDRGKGAPFADAMIHVFRMKAPDPATGIFEADKHTLVTLRFCDVRLVRFEGFNSQNALAELTIVPCEDPDFRYAVDFYASNGCDAELLCNEVEVVSAMPFSDEAMTSTGSIYSI